MTSRKILSSCILMIGLVGFSSCLKNKPIDGEYDGYFIYDYPSGYEKFSNFAITDPSKKEIIFNGSILKKKGRKINGKVDHIPNVGTGVEIDAELSGKPFSKKYSISGTFCFTQYYLSGYPPQKVTGTFSLSN